VDGVTSVADERFTPAGDEAGTPPGDRSFRPDVQGLRAVAILLVVLFHAGIPGISGGYVGVDVFFVISGFVITGVLLREHHSTGRTSIRAFYGRRARRIIPAATLVIIVTVIAAYHLLGPLVGHDTAIDGQWAALFLANFHFAAAQTNYLASQQPPSVLQNYWSLAVEEQFYIVYPAVFLLTAALARRFSLRTRLTVVLVVVIVSSYAYSIVYTSVNPQFAFFSPLTRAWELALGGLIAVNGPRLRRLRPHVATAVTWIGLGAIAVAGVTFTSATRFPGALVAIPVLGAGLVIAGGAARPQWGAERLLGRRPFLLLGLVSYSLYLWHWPILQIATQDRGVRSLPVWENLLLLALALGVSIATYAFVENPVRHAKALSARRWASIVLGLCLVAATLVVTSIERHRPVVVLGSLANVAPGSVCRSPSPSSVSKLRATDPALLRTSSRQSNGTPTSVLVVGDSTSCTLLIGLEAVGPAYGLQFENGAVVGCGIVGGTLAPFYLDGVNWEAYTKNCQAEVNLVESAAIERYHPRVIVWGSTYEHSAIEVPTRSGTATLQPGTAPWKSVMRQRISKRVDTFLGLGADVVLLEEPAPGDPPGKDVPSADEAYAQMNALLREVAAEHPGRVQTIDLGTRVCPSGAPCPALVTAFNAHPTTPAQVLRFDAMHYLPPAALWVAKWLVPRIAASSGHSS